eukprot:superscaffoldBa00001114_g9042
MKKSNCSEAVRLCPICQTNYILPSYLHPRCEAYLSAEHARLALTPQGACQFCACLPAEELQQQADAFSLRRTPTVGVSQMTPLPPSWALLLVLLSPCWETWSLITRAGGSTTVALSFSASVCQPYAGIAMLAEQPTPAHSLLGGDVYDQEPPAKCPLLWPHFMEPSPSWRQHYLILTNRALVSRYEPFTRVHRDMEKGFPTVPPLEWSLATILLPKGTFFGKRKPPLLTPQDQVYTLLSDCLHQCAAQIAAAKNNIALLSSSLWPLSQGLFPWS